VTSVLTFPAAPIDIDALARVLTGRLLRPGDPEYSTARLGHNLAYDQYPAAIVCSAWSSP
jgi:hypothetical protein